MIRHTLTGKNQWLYLLGISFALGFLNKYNIVFLSIGLFPSLVLTRRSMFQNKDLYGALAIALLLILPNLLWQYQNGFPVFTHMRFLSSSQLVNNSRIGFLMNQLLFFYPSLFIWLAGLLSVLFGKRKSEFRFVALTILITLRVFFFQAKGYYAIGLYPVLLAFGAVWIAEFLVEFKSIFLSLPNHLCWLFLPYFSFLLYL
jgi:4-amino-4-deoxy-L-arabinose transferase-like glycosyltransferase